MQQAELKPGTVKRAINAQERPTVRGKFFFAGDHKLYIRGVTYGMFRPREDDCEFPEPPVVEEDFTLMAANGVTRFGPTRRHLAGCSTSRTDMAFASWWVCRWSGTSATSRTRRPTLQT